MNKYGLLVVLVLGTVASDDSFKTLNEQLEQHQKELDQLRDGLLKIIGDWKSGENFLPFDLPTLPLKVSPMTFQYDGYTMSTSELTINGLEDISVDYLTISDEIIPEMIMVMTHIRVPRLTFQADRYHLRGEYWIFNIDESGELSGHIDGLIVYASLTLLTRGDNTEVIRMRLNFSMDDKQVTLHGSSKLINEKFMHKILEIQRDEKYYSFMLNKIKDAINNVLRGQTLEQLVEIIKAYADLLSPDIYFYEYYS